MTRRKIIFFHLGLLHPDYEEIAGELTKRDYSIERLNILENINVDIDLENVGVIDFRNCREYHNNLDRFLKFKRKLGLIAEKKKILIMTNPEMFEFTLKKSTYLNHLMQENIKIVPTSFIENGNDIKDLLNKIDNELKSIVIKPDIGSRANKLVRIKVQGGRFHLYLPFMENKKSASYIKHKEIDREGLANYLERYLNGTKKFIAQEYIPDARELCFVYLDNKYSHAFEKIGDVANEDTFKINHFNFNGKNLIINQPEKDMLKLADTVLDVLPSETKIQTPYIRIDLFMNNMTKELYVTEIEAGVPGLCVVEAGKTKEYCEALTKYL